MTKKGSTDELDDRQVADLYNLRRRYYVGWEKLIGVLLLIVVGLGVLFILVHEDTERTNRRAQHPDYRPNSRTDLDRSLPSR